MSRLLHLLLAFGFIASAMPFQSCVLEEVVVGTSCHDSDEHARADVHGMDGPTCPPHENPCVCKLSRHTTTSILKQFSPSLHEPVQFAGELLCLSVPEVIYSLELTPRTNPPPQSLPLLI